MKKDRSMPEPGRVMPFAVKREPAKITNMKVVPHLQKETVPPNDAPLNMPKEDSGYIHPRKFDCL